MNHGFTNQPGTKTVIDGMRSWQYPPPGSMRPLVNGWRSVRGAVLRSHSMQSSTVRSRASTCPLQRAMSVGSMSGGLCCAGHVNQGAAFGVPWPCRVGNAVPYDVWPQFLARHAAIGLSFNFGAAIKGYRAQSAQPLADRGLLKPQFFRKRSLTADGFDGFGDRVHASIIGIANA